MGTSVASERPTVWTLRRNQMRVGVLTGGGDCPGLNAVIRAIVRTGSYDHNCEFGGFRDGWRGPLEPDTQRLDVAPAPAILPRRGTRLCSAQATPPLPA